MILTLRSRLTLVYTSVFGVLLLAIAAVSYRVLAYQLDAEVSSNLAELTRGLHGYLRFDGGPPTVVADPNDPAETAFVDEATRYYQVFDAETGDLLVQSEAVRPLGLEFTPAEVRSFSQQLSTFDVQTDYGRIRLSNNVLEPAGGRRYLLQVGVSLESIDSALNRFLVLLVLWIPAGLLAAIALGGWTARIALTPLAELAAATRTIEIGGLRRRLPVRGARDELDDVAVAFNETLSRLEHAVDEMREFSSALAHELRTPLAALRGDIELAMAKPAATDSRRLAGQLEEIDKLKVLIDRILLLARAEAGELPIAMRRVDVGALAASLVDQLQPVAQAKDIEMACEAAGDALVTGDADWLKRLVLNLLDNAIKFTPAGGRIAVAVAREGGVVRLSVRDSGIGIDPDAAPHIFERFFRADPARSSGVEGAGLGLSLAKWIVDRHHGRIEVSSAPGSGSTFTVSLPADPQDFRP